MKPALCICALLAPVSTTTTVRVVVPKTELMKSTNSGRFIPLVIDKGELVVYGADQPPLPDVIWPPSTTPVVLFPREGAPLLCDIAAGANHPLCLIVLDGTWSSANRLRKRFASKNIPFARLPDDDRPSIYALRAGSFVGSLSTLEATARALRSLEGARGPAVEEALLHPFRVMVSRTLWLRGDIDDDDVIGDLPPGVSRHDINGRWRR